MADDGPLVWSPRPRDDAETLSAELAARGFRTLVAPVLSIRRHEDVRLDLDPIAALLFTSANGVRAFAAASGVRTLPAYAVGAGTGEAAREAGFGEVYVAGGDVHALADHVTAHRAPTAGALLHVAGVDRAGDLAGMLAERGFDVRRTVLYEAVPVDALPEEVGDALRREELAAVVVFSPRTARVVSRLIVDAGLAGRTGRVVAACLSPAVAARLAGLDWRETAVAAEPTRTSLLQALQHALERSDAVAHEDRADERDTRTGAAGPPAGDGESMNASDVIDRFGGIRPMAQKLGVAVSTVQGWKARNRIPENRWPHVEAAAAANGISLDDIAASEEAPAASPWEKETPEQRPDNGPAAAGTETEPAKTETPPTSSPSTPAPATPAPAAAIPAKSGGSGLAWAAVILALVAVLGLFSRGYWAPAVDPVVEKRLAAIFGPAAAPAPPAGSTAALSNRIEALDGRFAGLEAALRDYSARLDRLASEEADGLAAAEFAELRDRLADAEGGIAALAAESGPAVDLAPVEDSIAALRDRLDALDGRAEAARETLQGDVARIRDELGALGGRVAEVDARLTRIETERGAFAASQSAVALAVAQIAAQARAGQTFEEALAGLRGLAAEDSEIAAILPALEGPAATGVASTAALQRDFGLIARHIDRAERLAGAEGMLEETLARLRGFVSIRRHGEGAERTAVERAEAALERGDLGAAVTAVKPLASADPRIAGWIDRAEARLAVERALDALQALAVARIAAAAE